MLRPPPTSTLFPYTTLFRSCSRSQCSAWCWCSGRWHSRVPPSHSWSGGLENAIGPRDRKSTRLNSSHRTISYAVFCLKKKKKKKNINLEQMNKIQKHIQYLQ